MKPVELRIENLKAEITGYLATLEALVRQRNALKLYDVNQHCEEIYGELLNELLKHRHPRLKLISANTPEHPNFKGIDLIDERRRVIVQVTSSSSNKKVKHTFDEINNQRRYDGFTIYFVFVAGESEKIDLRKNRPPKFILCKRDNLLYPEDFTALLQGRSAKTYENVLKILQRHLGVNDHMVTVEKCFDFINQIALLVKSVDHVRCMCEEFLQMSQGEKGFGGVLLQRINHQVCNNIPDSLPDLGSIRQAWARNTQVYGFLLGIERQVFEIDKTGRDDCRRLDVLEVKKLTESLLSGIYRIIRCMCKATGISEEVAFTELTKMANEF